MYSEKATKFCKIFTLLLSYVVPVKSKVKISQNVVAFSECMNFKLNWSIPLNQIARKFRIDEMRQFSPDLNFNPQPARPILDKVPHDYLGKGDFISEFCRRYFQFGQILK